MGGMPFCMVKSVGLLAPQGELPARQQRALGQSDQLRVAKREPKAATSGNLAESSATAFATRGVKPKHSMLSRKPKPTF